MSQRPILAVIGGTGDLGGGLAWRWAAAGYTVIIGSRSAEKAETAAAEIRADHPQAEVRGDENAAAAAAADLVVLTVPFAAQAPNLEAIRDACRGKVLLDCTVPLVPPKVARVQLPQPGCAALLAQQAVGDEVDVCSAFHNVGAEHLRGDHPVDCDVLVFGDKVAARDQVVALVEAAGMKAWHAGPLANSAAAEALTSVLIGINKRYGIRGSGLRITGEPSTE
ncbi:MAG: NADPH-dependent F420 reductase [Acidobacteria bacterium]|nr:MAG: NADPH-dependent F420 reductase [Acidobacteriota bacterium]